MKKTATIELIRGIFTPEEAKDILLQMLNSKINFHNLKNWSHRERFGKADSYSEKRLVELEESKKKLTKLITETSSEDQNIAIKSNIKITIE